MRERLWQALAAGVPGLKRLGGAHTLPNTRSVLFPGTVGNDLLEATPAQVRLGALLGRAEPPAFAHHALIRRPDGTKLSKAEGATALGDLLEAGRRREELLGDAAHGLGLLPSPRPLTFEEAIDLAA